MEQWEMRGRRKGTACLPCTCIHGVAWARGAAWWTWPVGASLIPLLEEQQVYLLERRPVLRVPPPAAQHQLVHRVGADGGLREIRLWKQKGEL